MVRDSGRISEVGWTVTKSALTPRFDGWRHLAQRTNRVLRDLMPKMIVLWEKQALGCWIAETPLSAWQPTTGAHFDPCLLPSKSLRLILQAQYHVLKSKQMRTLPSLVFLRVKVEDVDLSYHWMISQPVSR